MSSLTEQNKLTVLLTAYNIACQHAHFTKPLDLFFHHLSKILFGISTKVFARILNPAAKVNGPISTN